MNYLQYVNTKHGSKSVKRFSNGNTLPLVQRPYGFASFVPQTDSSRGKWFYNPDDRSFEGIRMTHIPSPWIGDHGAMVIMPQIETPYLQAEDRWAGMDPEETVLEPGYMKIRSKRAFCDIELTPTVYGARVRVKFDRDFDKYISVLPVDGMCGYEFDKDTNSLYCYTDCNDLQGYDSDKFKAYFVFRFADGAINPGGILTDGENGRENKLKTEGKNTGIHLAVNGNEIEFTVAESFISYGQADINLQNDADFASFDELRETNEKIWNERLSAIEITADEEKMKVFYSCMYRLSLYPHKAYEIDKNGRAVHYAPSDGSVKEGYRYTDNGFWDTYRTVYPLLAIIARDEYKEMLEGFIQDYKDGGWLPCWTALDAKNCMPSTMMDAVIADAAVKGVISGELLETAFEGMEKNANVTSPVPAYGRMGCEDYLKLGYVPCDKYNESVNLTLDAAYCDYCLSVVADILGYKDKAKMYAQRSENYKNIFDGETGFMRGRTENGSFRAEFDPISWGKDYTEAAAWQTSFAVQHDYEGLAELYGGTDKLIEKLDEFFAAPEEYRVGGYEKEIHEMTEFAAGKWGQCAISNQPSFHIPFIYAQLGCADKTNYWVRRLCDEAFSSADDGFPGDEDNGTMAAWYIFCAMGIYPLCPGKDEYVRFEGFAENVRISGREVKFRDGKKIVSRNEI